jgi:N6-adenosine-specific RNA methylase IME4
MSNSPIAADNLDPTFGDLDRVELFQRAPRPGWSGWGNESAVAS